MRDYCSGSPDIIDGEFIGDCCKLHDNAVGQAGTYNPVTPHIAFYSCLRAKGVHFGYVIVYTLLGTLFSLLKYPHLSYTRYQWRKKKL